MRKSKMGVEESRNWTLKQRNDMKWSKKMNQQNMNKKTGTLEAGMKEVRKYS